MSYNLPARRLVSQSDQTMIQRADVPRSKFEGSWTRKTTFDAGKLIPILVDEVLPGDHMKYDVTAYLRMATPLFPIFDNQKIETFFFFVPNRLLWTNWVKFMGEQASPADSISYLIPQIVSPAGGFAINSIYDQFGLPCVGQITAGQTVTINALPLRAYNLIYHQWFRDENLQTTWAPSTGDGPDASANYVIADRAKAHDYFTTALPWPQKFVTALANVPMTGTAPITGIGTLSGNFPGVGGVVLESDGTSPTYANYRETATAAQVVVKGTLAVGGIPQIFANLSASTAYITINALRQAWMIQALVERDARGGTRYIELVKSHFGVTSPDARQQRAEYIGGGSSPLVVTPVAQTATGGGGVGSLGAAATATGGHRADYAATEHGYIIGLINVRTELSYQQGIHKMWRRLSRYDFYWPALAGLGEQAVLREEIYATGVDAEDNTVFGYQERWQEYRTRMSEVTGMFRSTHAGTIDPWHLAQRFTAAPTLGATFIADTPPMTRILAAASTNMQYLADILIRREAVRPIPVFGTPGALGRF